MAAPSTSSALRHVSPAPEEVAAAATNAPWEVVHKDNRAIPFLHQVVIDDVSIQKYARDPVVKKKVRYLLVTHSDGTRKIGDHQGFTAKELSIENTPANNALMVQLGERLAKKLGIGRGNSAANETWDVLAQLPMKYLAFFRARKVKKWKSSPDLYIAGHHSDVNFDSVEQFARHLEWLATSDNADDSEACACKVCHKERTKGKRVADQIKRKKRWTDNVAPSTAGLPDWYAFGEQVEPDWNWEDIVGEHREVKRAERRARGAQEDEETSDEEEDDDDDDDEDVEMED